MCEAGRSRRRGGNFSAPEAHFSLYTIKRNALNFLPVKKLINEHPLAHLCIY